MNKLVSKNPVQRFKQGKKIVKALWGIDLAYIDNPSVMTASGHGPKISDVHIPTKQERQLGNNLAAIGAAGAAGASGNLIATKSNVANKILNAMPSTGQNPYYDPYTEGLTLGGMVATPIVVAAQGNKNNQQKKNHIPLGKVQAMRQKYLGKSNMDIAKEETHNYLEGLRNKYVRPFNKKNNSSTKTVIPVNNYYLKGFENRKDEIAKLGGVRAMQNELIKLGLLNDKFGADGRWGKNTEAAYQKYLSLKNIPVYEKPETPSVAAMAGIYSEENKPLYQRIRFKQGGQLVSKNPVKRFKLRTKI